MKPERKGLWGRVIGSVAVLVFVVGMAQPLLADAFDTGNKWLGSSEIYQLGYVAGAVDAFETVTLCGTHDYGWMVECTGGGTGWTIGQVSAVLEKYFEDHPEDRHLIAASLVAYSLREACQ